MIKILLIDPQQVTARGVQLFLEDSGLAVVHTAIDGEFDLTEMAAACSAKVILMDITAVGYQKNTNVSAPVIGFTNIGQRSELLALLAGGINNHISKHAPL